jgi:hypothetical protein
MNMFIVPTVIGRVVMPEDEMLFFRFLRYLLTETDDMEYPRKKAAPHNMMHINAETYMLRKGYEVVC